MGYDYRSSEYMAANRFTNLDGIEAKIITHLIGSKTHYAEDVWRLLKYATPDALSKPALSEGEKKALVFDGTNGQPSATREARVFMAPFIDDAWQEQCSSLYVYVSAIRPLDRMRAEVVVNVEVVVHSQISVVAGNGDPDLNPDANPRDSDGEGNIVVAVKSRATTLVKNVVAELNGIYLDGVGYLYLEPLQEAKGKVDSKLWNVRSFYGHSISFVTTMSSTSDSPRHGF